MQPTAASEDAEAKVMEDNKNFLVDSKEIPLTEQYLSECFAYENAFKKGLKLCSTFRAIRVVKGDGNCYYRACLFSFFENLPQSQQSSALNTIHTDAKALFIKAGYDEFIYEDFLEPLSEIYQKEFALIDLFNAKEFSNQVIMLFRLIVAATLRVNRSDYEAFVNVTEHGTFDRYLTSVEGLGCESDDLAIAILCKFLKISCTIVVVDNRDTSKEEPEEHTFGYGDSMHIYLLYRPGHYDILCPI